MVMRSSSDALRIGIPSKGRMGKEVRELLSSIFRSAWLTDLDRRLSCRVARNVEVVLLHARDIAPMVENGAIDVGITGWDLIQETKSNAVSIADTGLGGCRLSLALPQGEAELAQNPRVATVFPELAREYFTSRGVPCEILAVSGSVESAVVLGMADAIVDLVDTGNTLRANGLREADILLYSSAHLVMNPDQTARLENREEFRTFLAALEASNIQIAFRSPSLCGVM